MSCTNPSYVVTNPTKLNEGKEIAVVCKTEEVFNVGRVMPVLGKIYELGMTYISQSASITVRSSE